MPSQNDEDLINELGTKGVAERLHADEIPWDATAREIWLENFRKKQAEKKK